MGGASWQRPWIRFIGASFESLGIFGDGSDLDVTLSAGQIVASRDMYYNNLTLLDGAELFMASYRLFVRETLTMAATAIIHNDGYAGDANGDSPPTPPTGTMAGGALGGYGGWSTLAADGDGGNGASIAAGGLGGTGGTGGLGNTVWIPGSPGTTSLAVNAGGQSLPAAYCGCMRGCLIINISQKIGGGGGGSGAASDADDSPAPSGGNGGGPLLVFAKTILGTSGAIIRAVGGNGGDSAGNDTGGGGGGGGGFVGVYTTSDVNTLNISFSTNGGLGGAPTGSGERGADGNEGQLYILGGQT